ncbi:hypothetical protein GXW82_13885 [Streptacidiphilus sp. 4-A2]|nr:hypothetical protein [Streptacidiphilus sp. 4-A2]
MALGPGRTPGTGTPGAAPAAGHHQRPGPCARRPTGAVLPAAVRDRAQGARAGGRPAAERRGAERPRTRRPPPLAWTQLRQRVTTAHGQLTADEVDWLLTELVKHQILLTDLMPPPDTEDPIGHILARIGEHQELPQAGELRAVRYELARYEAAPPGAGQALWRQATERMRALYPADRLVHVDLALDVDARLPQTVRQEAERAAEALWAVSAGRPGPAHLRQYHQDFLERYGTGRAVPVLELLDPQTGLGAPAGYALPGSTRRLRTGEPADPRDPVLLALAQQAAAAGGGHELVLDAGLLDRLTGTGTPPPSLDLLAQLHADSAESLAAGEFTLVVTGTGRVAGAAAGCYATLLRGPEGSGPADAAAAAPCADPQALRAQLSFRTLKAHTADTVRVPRLLHHTISLAQFADRGAPGVLGLADLAVVAEHDRLAVVSRRLGREIVPTLPSMVATDAHAPDAARLLDEITRSGDSAWPRWRWGAAESLPYLPRVRYGRSILSLARWQPDDPRLRGAPDAEDADRWLERFGAWRTRWDVPGWCRASPASTGSPSTPPTPTNSGRCAANGRGTPTPTSRRSRPAAPAGSPPGTRQRTRVLAAAAGRSHPHHPGGGTRPAGDGPDATPACGRLRSGRPAAAAGTAAPGMPVGSARRPDGAADRVAGQQHDRAAVQHLPGTRGRTTGHRGHRRHRPRRPVGGAVGRGAVGVGAVGAGMVGVGMVGPLPVRPGAVGPVPVGPLPVGLRALGLGAVDPLPPGPGVVPFVPVRQRGARPGGLRGLLPLLRPGCRTADGLLDGDPEGSGAGVEAAAVASFGHGPTLPRRTPSAPMRARDTRPGVAVPGRRGDARCPRRGASIGS